LKLHFSEARRTLKKAIHTSKRECFLEFCDWGNAYKTVVKRICTNRHGSPTDPMRLKDIVGTVFPKRFHSLAPRIHIISGPFALCDSLAVTAEEILKVARNIKSGKAPGPDAIPNRAVKLAMSLRLETFARVFTQCLYEGIFPDRWKLRKLVLLPKPCKPAEEASSYRPICLIDALWKVWERFICTSLHSAINSSGGLSLNQYGYRMARSTTDAIRKVTDIALKAIEGKGGTKKYCLIVTPGVRNAFNTADWGCTLDALSAFDVPSYLYAMV